MIYVSSSCIKNKYIHETIQQYAKAGITNIELSGGTIYYEDIEKNLYELKKKYNLNYACHAYFPPRKKDIVVNLASCNDEIYQDSIRHYEECIELLRRLEIETLSIHAGFLVEVTPKEIGSAINSRVYYPKDEAYSRFISAYGYINDICAKEGISLYLENNVLSAENYQLAQQRNYFMMTHFDNIMELERELEFRFLLDLGHLHVSTKSLGLDYSLECEKLAHKIGWIHLSDNDGIVDQHKPLDGESEVLKQYRKIVKNEIPVTLETNGTIEEILESINLIS